MRGQRSHDSSWRQAAWLRPAALVWAIVVAATWLAAQVGVTGAIDAAARRIFYMERGTRGGGARVLFVAIDEDTVHEWGPPPWPWSRYQALIGGVLAGGPRLVAVLEPGPRVLPGGAVPADLARAVADGKLILPPAEPGFHQPAVVLDSRGVVEAIELGDPDALSGRSITADVLARLGVSAGQQLAVNFIGPPDALPTLPAHHVARGEVPPSTFADRVVVIGLRGARFTNEVPTPVGAMSPSEVHAHALHAVVTQATWRSPPGWAIALVVLAIAAFAIGGPRRAASARGAAVRLGVVGAGLVLLSYLVFAWAQLAFGPGAVLVALALGGAGGLLLERHDAQRGVAELHHQVTQRLRQASGAQAGVSVTVIHDRFAETLRTYVDLESCAWAELAPGAWHVEVGRWYGERPPVHERRRDVRRDPWRLPYGSHRPEWCNRPFLDEDHGQRTLLVPLAAFGRLLGFWIVNVRDDVVVTDAQLRAIEVISDDAAVALEEHRLERRGAAAATDGDHLPSALVDAVRAARHDALTLAHLHGRTRAALDRLPVGVLTATTWGHVEQCNAAMQRFLTAAGVDAPEKIGVVAMLARVTGVSEAAVRDVLRELATTGNALRLETRVAPTGAPPQIYELVLARAQLAEGAGGDDAEPGAASLVITAAERSERPLVALDWRWSAQTAGARHVVDLAQLVQETLAQLADEGSWSGPPIVELRAATSIVVARGDELADAVRTILVESAAGAPGDVDVSIDDDADAITIHVVHRSTSVPQSDVAAVRSALPEQAPPHLAALVRARVEVEANHGRLEIESDLAQGTTIAIRLPKPGSG